MEEQKNEEEKETVPEEEMIKMPKAELENFKKELNDMREMQKVLMSISDKKALALYHQRNKEKLPSEVGLRMLNGKIITGWRTKEDLGAYKEPLSQRWIEKQTIELLFEDKTTLELELQDFNRKYEMVTCKKVGEIRDEVGNVALKLVRLDNGQEYTVGVQFVN